MNTVHNLISGTNLLSNNKNMEEFKPSEWNMTIQKADNGYIVSSLVSGTMIFVTLDEALEYIKTKL